MKPKFIRQDANKLKRLGNKWRKPKGIHSKMRNNFKGHRKNISVGWKSPKLVHSLVGNLNNVIVYTLKQIEMIEPMHEGITIANSIGLKKRLPLLNRAKERGIKVLNIKNIDDYIKRHQEKRAKRKKSKEKTAPEIKEKIKQEEKPIEKPKEEMKKEDAKEELDKLLIKRT